MPATVDHPSPAPTSPPRAPGHAPAFLEGLRRNGARVALVTADGTLTYDELAGLVDDTALRLGSGRRLVLVETGNDVASVVGYLAALQAGHVALLGDRDDDAQLAALTATFDPDVVLGADGVPRDRHRGGRHTLHPELALLLATSGSTGRPRLVRLSSAALEANAAAITTYLGLGSDDRAALTLPLHYCYGLSVLNSNLLCGASVLLSGSSWLNPRFWETVRAERVTGLHGVPYSFELLDAVGFAEMDLPDLRYVTQAGGRLAPEQVRRWAEVGRERGWELVVMYGQTEATARMAYLPPHLAAEHPDAVGVAVHGSRLRVDPHPDPAAAAGEDGVGELVFEGPGVMLGYATTPADLAVGRTLTELRTGDIGRRDADGMFRVVGRLGRFVKPFGVRVDLDGVEHLLAEHGAVAASTGDDEQLLVGVRHDGSDDLVERTTALLVRRLGVPGEAMRVAVVDDLPRRPNGKIDRPALRRLLAPAQHATAGARVPSPRPAAEPTRRGGGDGTARPPASVIGSLAPWRMWRRTTGSTVTSWWRS